MQIAYGYGGSPAKQQVTQYNSRISAVLRRLRATFLFQI